MSLKIQQELSKEEVLEGYLNTIYFGRGAYGIEAASEAYFDHPAKDLNLRESAVLATVLNNPSKYDPANGKEAKDDLKGRYAYVLDSMAEMETITPEQRDKALKKLPKFPKIAAQSQFGGQRGHMLTLVKQEILARGIASEDEIDGGGLRITTTFDPGVMADVEEAVDEQRPDAGMPGPAGNKDLHIGAATVDTAIGDLLGFYGGQDYLESQINWAVAGGMAGSTMKAATDVAAIRDGFSLNDTFEGNSPIDIAGTEFEQPGRHRLRLGRLDDRPPPRTPSTPPSSTWSTRWTTVPRRSSRPPRTSASPATTAERWGIPRQLDRHPGERRRHPRHRPGQPDQHGQRLRDPRQRRHPQRGPRRAEGRRQDGEILYEEKHRSKETVDTDITSDVSYALQQVVEYGSGTEALALDRPAAGKTGTATNDEDERVVVLVRRLHAPGVDRRDVRPRPRVASASTCPGPTVPTSGSPPAPTASPATSAATTPPRPGPRSWDG